LPEFAKGGLLKDIVGENGPELIHIYARGTTDLAQTAFQIRQAVMQAAPHIVAASAYKRVTGVVAGTDRKISGLYVDGISVSEVLEDTLQVLSDAAITSGFSLFGTFNLIVDDRGQKKFLESVADGKLHAIDWVNTSSNLPPVSQSYAGLIDSTVLEPITPTKVTRVSFRIKLQAK
jgi:hypothetical protein